MVMKAVVVVSTMAGFSQAIPNYVVGIVDAPSSKPTADRQPCVLVVKQLDRLGCNALAVRATAKGLTSAGVRVHCLLLGRVELTRPPGKSGWALLPLWPGSGVNR
jgi:putative DNA-invertase from lambdoid prophage Rac